MLCILTLALLHPDDLDRARDADHNANILPFVVQLASQMQNKSVDTIIGTLMDMLRVHLCMCFLAECLPGQCNFPHRAQPSHNSSR